MIRHALRTIGRMPGLAAVVILSLGVGIGVNTTVFSWIQAVLLKPIPGVDGSGSFRWCHDRRRQECERGCAGQRCESSC